MKVIIKPVGKPARVVDWDWPKETEKRLDLIRGAIGGGWYESAPGPIKTRLYCDEEGLLKELPYNALGLVGDLLIVNERTGPHGTYCVDLTAEQIEKVLPLLNS